MPRTERLGISFHLPLTDMTTNQTPRLLKAQEAATYLGLAKNTVYDWIQRGYLPHHRFGRTVRIDERDLHAFIDRGRTQTQR